MRFLLPTIIAAVLLAGWYFVYKEDTETTPNHPAVVAQDPSNSSKKELPIRLLSLDETAIKTDNSEFSPPKLEDVRVGSKVNFELPDGPTYEGFVDSIEAKGTTTTIVQGDITEGGFFIFSYGPSATFGSLTTLHGSFEYLGSEGSVILRRPPIGKLTHDIRLPKGEVGGVAND